MATVPLHYSARFIADERYRHHRYAANHPLAIPRVSLTLDLIEAFDAIDEGEYLPSLMASDEALAEFHTLDYIHAMQKAESDGRVGEEARRRHNLGNIENPFFPGFFTTPATAAGGSVLAAEQVLAGHMAFSPAGGMHHARPDRAEGFCFFNDPVLAIKRLRREGLKVVYLDIDAHHGDGVEEAFADDADVLTVSLHMDCGYAYPFKGGQITDTGPLDNAVNLPLPQNTNDSEYLYVFERLWPQVMQRFAPDAVVLQAGTDSLFADPLGKLSLSTEGFLEVVTQVIQSAPRHDSGVPLLAVLGGGGYHPLVLARCWLGVWGLLSGRDLAEELPERAQAVLRAVDWDMDEDEPHYENLFQRRFDGVREGELRDDVRKRLESLLLTHPRISA